MEEKVPIQKKKKSLGISKWRTVQENGDEKKMVQEVEQEAKHVRSSSSGTEVDVSELQRSGVSEESDCEFSNADDSRGSIDEHPCWCQMFREVSVLIPVRDLRLWCNSSRPVSANPSPVELNSISSDSGSGQHVRSVRHYDANKATCTFNDVE